MAIIYKTAKAEDDLINIWLYIAKDSPIAADNFIDGIETCCKTIADNPHIGPARDDIADGFRYHPFQKYLLFYRIAGDGIELVRVIHSARDLKKIF